MTMVVGTIAIGNRWLVWNLLLVIQRMYDMGALSHRDAYRAGEWLAWSLLRVGHMGEAWWIAYEQVALVISDDHGDEDERTTEHVHEPLRGHVARLWQEPR